MYMITRGFNPLPIHHNKGFQPLAKAHHKGLKPLAGQNIFKTDVCLARVLIYEMKIYSLNKRQKLQTPKYR
jgi:hypothetical protein